MNREIKFRGMLLDKSGWAYGSLINNCFLYIGHAEYPDRTPVCNIITGKYDGDCWEDIMNDDEKTNIDVIPHSVGQYTGLKDKNGKEIYEGDVMKARQRTVGKGDKTKYKDFNLPVEWYDGGFHLPFKDYGEYRFREGRMEDFEIIGNIYEHPHLLTQVS